MKNFILVLFSLLCVACGSVKQVTPTERVVTETRIETVYRTDTVLLEIPKIVEKVVTKDTVSVLENDYAKSQAVVTDGFLAHSLETKPVQKPVEVQTKIVYRDSVIVKDNVIVQTVEVEKELTGWQTFKMKTGGFALGIIVLLIVCVILYFVKPLNLFKL